MQIPTDEIKTAKSMLFAVSVDVVMPIQLA